MLCTGCKTNIKPVVAIDIDGTLGDYHEHLIRFAESYLGVILDRDYRGDMEFKKWWSLQGIPLDEFRDIKLAYRQGAQKRSMPVYTGAPGAIQIMGDKAEIWITTTRPYLRHDSIDPDTMFWLERHLIPGDGLIYGDDKYEDLLDLIERDRVVAIVDDLSEELVKANNIFGEKSIQYGTPWNSASGWAVQDEARYGSWATIKDVVCNLIDQWYRERN